MTKLFTKFSLLFIGLMLCAGNAWGKEGYNDPATFPNDGYYQETDENGIVYRIDYSCTGNVYMVSRTPKSITSCNNHEDDYKYKEAHAYVTNVFNGSSPDEIAFKNSITFYKATTAFPGQPASNINPEVIPVCLKKSNFNNYSGTIKLPAYPSDGKAIVYEGWSVGDVRYTDSNYGDPFTYVFGENVTVEVPKFSDQAKYEAKEVNYFGTYLLSNGSGTIHSSSPYAYPWNGHLTNAGGVESTTITTGDDDWVLYANGILVVNYDGAMPDFAYEGSPWYSYASSIYAVKIGADVTSIGEYAFYNCTNLTEVVFQGNNVTSLGECCFQACSKLHKITLPSGVTTLATNVFNGCERLISVELPATVTTIAENAFNATLVLNAVTILNDSPNAETIHSGAFNNLSTVFIPDAAACDYINLHSSESWIAKVFKSVSTGDVLECNEANNSCGTDLTWEYNDGVLTISGEGTNMADYNTSDNLCPWSANLANITSVILPNTLEHIGECAFYGCTGLKEITLPASVTEIGESAFLSCTSLKRLNMLGTNPPTLESYVNGTGNVYPFAGVLDVYVPANSEDEYLNEWGASKSAIVMDLSYLGMGVMELYAGCKFNYYPVGALEVVDDIVGCSDNTAVNTNDKLEELAANGGTLLDRFTIVRPIQANGYLNTLCLPFDMDADQIAASDLNGAEIFEFNEQQSGATVDMVLSQVSEIVAGMPYFFRYPNGATPNLSELNFYDVTISTADVTPKTVDAGTFKLVGTLDNQLLNSGTNYLFLGAENALFYPDLEGATEDELTIRPFRAYFESTGGASLAPARFVFGRQTPTDFESVQSSAVRSQKIIENGQLFIERNGVRFNVSGQIVK